MAKVYGSILSSNLPKINKSIPNCWEFPIAFVPIIVLFQSGIFIPVICSSVNVYPLPVSSTFNKASKVLTAFCKALIKRSSYSSKLNFTISFLMLIKSK